MLVSGDSAVVTGRALHGGGVLHEHANDASESLRQLRGVVGPGEELNLPVVAELDAEVVGGHASDS